MAKNKRTFLKRDRFTITINGPKGIKQITLGQFAKKFFITFSLLIFLSLTIGAFVINYLYKEFSHLSQIRSELSAENSDAKQQLANLRQQYENKAVELSEVELKLHDIETMIGVSAEPDLELSKRVDVARMTLGEKKFLLENIPSGAPLEKVSVTSPYGTRNHPVLNKSSFHTGIDLRGKTGTPVQVTANGVVEYAGYHDGSGYGNLVIIHHAFGFKSMYAHLSSVDVKVGDAVTKGQHIAKVGSTGLSSGPHLHYEIRYVQRTVNPDRFMDWSLQNYEPIFKQQRRVNWDSLLKAAKHVMKTVQQ
ncbi:MAG: M23 family metallopeptidase [Campylobacterota bacterium]